MTSDTPQTQNLDYNQAALSAVLTHFKEELFPKVSDTFAVSIMLETIHSWADGELFMTRLLCQYVLAQASQISDGNEVDLVNTIVEKTILEDWETNDAAVHFSEIRDALLSYEHRDSLLILYIQILQRGLVAANNSPEQSVLLKSGLVTLEDDYLKVTNAIYARFFDLNWVEQQLPGITRPVTIARSQAESSHSSSLSKQYSKMTVFACGAAVLVAAGSAYLKEVDSRQALATVPPAAAPPAAVLPTVPSATVPSATVPTVSDPAASEPAPSNPVPSDPIVSETTISTIQANGGQTTTLLSAEALVSNVINAPAQKPITERNLFDNGVEHATNGRWLPMLREFCTISEGSAYFVPAKRQLSRWLALYQDDIQVAHTTLIAEGNSACPIAEATKEEALEAFTN